MPFICSLFVIVNRNGNPFWGAFTLFFVGFPMLSSLIIHIFKKCRKSNVDTISSDFTKDDVSNNKNAFLSIYHKTIHS